MTARSALVGKPTPDVLGNLNLGTLVVAAGWQARTSKAIDDAHFVRARQHGECALHGRVEDRVIVEIEPT